MSGLVLGFLAGAGTVLYFNYKQQQEAKEEQPPLAPRARSSYAQASSHDRSGSFLTDLLHSLWKHFNVAVSNDIKSTVEPTFKDLSGPLKTLKFVKVDLGDVPLKLDNCIIHEAEVRNNQEFIQMELDVVWDGNCDIQLQCDYLGKFGVKSLKLAGRMSVMFQPLMNELPLFGAVQYGFINTPVLDLDFTGIASIADMSSLKKTICDSILGTIAGMMVLPNRMLTKMVDHSSYFQMYSAPVGVARLTLVSGRDFEDEKHTLGGVDVPDVYCIFSVGDKTWKSKTVKNANCPVWSNAVQDFLLYDHDQILDIQVFDEDTGSLDKDDFLGSTQSTIGDILLSGKSKELELVDENKKSTKSFITISCDLLSLTDSVESLTKSPKLDNHYCGLLTVLLSQAYDIPEAKDKETPEYYYVKVEFGDDIFHSAVVDGAAPSFDCAFPVPLSNKYLHQAGVETANPPVVFSLYKGEAVSDDCPKIGSVQVPYAALLKSPEHSVQARQKVFENGPSIEYSISLRGIDEASEPSFTTRGGSILDPSQVEGEGTLVKVTIAKGWGFQVEKRTLKRDIPDVYCNVTFGSSPQVWRTATIKDNLSPVWNEAKLYKMNTHSQILNIHAFDEDNGVNDPDDDLGKARLSIGKVLLAGGSFDCELKLDGKSTGAYVKILCEIVEQEESIPKLADDAAPSPESASSYVLAEAEDNLPTGEIGTFGAALDKPPPKMKISVVGGTGFQVEKKRFGKGDIPDCYCILKAGPQKFQTATIKNQTSPEWNESVTFEHSDTLNLEVFDEDGGSMDPDDFLGSAQIPFKDLNGDVTVELKEDGKPNGCVVTLRCVSEP